MGDFIYQTLIPYFIYDDTALHNLGHVIASNFLSFLISAVVLLFPFIFLFKILFCFVLCR